MDLVDWLGKAPFPASKKCRIPEDLDKVSHRGPEDALAGSGVAARDVERIWEASRALYRTGATPALQVCIRRRGRVVLNRSLGHARGNAPEDAEDAEKVPCTPGTPMNVFSAAKLVTAMLIHRLDERGDLHLEDRVCDYIPEFARHNKQWITLRHLLSHRAGIPNIPHEAMDLDLLGDPERITEMLCDMERDSRAGRLVAYHAISGGFVLSEVVRRATGESIRDVLNREFREPLGLRWMHYGAAPEELDQVALNAFTGPPPPPPLRQILRRALGLTLPEVVELSNDPRFLSGVIPSGNVLTTAQDMSAFLQCLLNGGELDGTRIFQERTIRHALNEASYREIDFTLMMPLRFGLGPMLGDSPVGIFGPRTHRAFGHVGLSNVFCWADPDREIAVSLLTSGKPIMSLHVVRLFQWLGAVNEVFEA